MDILSLPHVFLNQLMRTIDIGDRLRIRRTCRAFEKLVAETDAGQFDRGKILSAPRHPGSLSLKIDDQKFDHIELSEDELERFLHLRRRLFKNISLGNFEIDLEDDVYALEFILELTKNFNINYLRFQVETKFQLEKSLQVLANLTYGECIMQLWFMPETEQLLSIPPLRSLKITSRPNPGQNSSELLVNLLAIHRSLAFSVEMEEWTLDEWKEVLQILSEDSRKRRVKIEVKCSTLLRCLSSCGVTQMSMEGDRCGEFEVMIGWGKYESIIHLRYRRCVMEITGLDWNDGNRNAYVDIANCDQF